MSHAALVACGVVNSLCNSLLEADGGALNGELFSGRSVGHAVGLRDARYFTMMVLVVLLLACWSCRTPALCFSGCSCPLLSL